MPVPPVFIDGALNVAQNFFLVLLRLIDIGCCFLGTKYLPDRKGKGEINALLRITRATDNDLFLKLPMCFRKKKRGVRYTLNNYRNYRQEQNLCYTVKKVVRDGRIDKTIQSYNRR